MIDLRDIDAIAERLEAAREFLHIDAKGAQLKTLDAQTAQPGFWDNVDVATEVSRQASNIRSTLASFSQAEALLADCRTALELATEDTTFAKEAQDACEQLVLMLDAFEVESWFSGPYDEGSCVLTINPGSGGLEAQDWTDMLYRMYTRYCENKCWKLTVLDVVPGEGIGIERASFEIEGRFAYGMLRSEVGVHRLVRISPTDTKARRHTTFASVEVVPVLPDDVEVDLKDTDLNIDVYRSHGHGGQGVNTTDSAVRITHIPTGIVVTCQNERSQLQNKEWAMRVLRGKLYELEQRKREEELAAITGEKMDNSFGSQIRSYVLYPYQMVKDLRSEWETGNPDAFLGGDIEECIIAYHRWHTS